MRHEVQADGEQEAEAEAEPQCYATRFHETTVQAGAEVLTEEGTRHRSQGEERNQRDALDTHGDPESCHCVDAVSGGHRDGDAMRDRGDRVGNHRRRSDRDDATRRFEYFAEWSERAGKRSQAAAQVDQRERQHQQIGDQRGNRRATDPERRETQPTEHQNGIERRVDQRRHRDHLASEECVAARADTGQAHPEGGGDGLDEVPDPHVLLDQR